MKNTIKKYNMLSSGDCVLVGLSGGADSVALLHWLKELEGELKITVCAAHFNHCLRGQESDRDEEFSKNLCQSLNVPFVSEKGDVPNEAKKTHETVEECARHLRYDFFERAAKSLGCNKIATAHNSDDNTETVLLNLTRGTGTKGLRGIPPVRGNIIRPLIETSRDEIEVYIRANNLEHITDSSNLTDDYTRNLLRHNVIPVLKGINPNLNATVGRMSELISCDEEALDSLAKDFVSKEFDGKSLPIKPLRKLPYAVKSRVIRLICPKKLSKTHVDAVLKLIENGGLGFADIPGVRLTKENNRLYIGIDEKFTSR